jgi:uncharacterized protein YndB with AHSA1/START domain
VGPVSASRSIDAPRDRVFDLLGDLANRPAFTDHFMSDFRLERLESRGVGASARFRLDSGMWVETVITEIARPHRILERGKGGRWDRIPIWTAWELVEGAAADRTELTLTFWTEPSHPLDRLRERLGAGRRYRRWWNAALRRLADLVEESRAVERVAVAGADRVAR